MKFTYILKSRALVVHPAHGTYWEGGENDNVGHGRNTITVTRLSSQRHEAAFPLDANNCIPSPRLLRTVGIGYPQPINGAIPAKISLFF